METNNSFEVGDAVYAVGNPQGLEGTFSQGIISSLREFKESKIIQITAPISPGSSGGPVLSAKGEVIGVSVATFRGGQNLNFAIPASYLSKLLEKQASLIPFSSSFQDKDSDSVFTDLGEKSTKGVEVSTFLWDTSPIATGRISYSILNRLQIPIKNISGLIIFYQGRHGEDPVDVRQFFYQQIIPPGLAKRAETRVDGSVQQINTERADAWVGVWGKGKIEYRILNFEISSD